MGECVECGIRRLLKMDLLTSGTPCTAPPAWHTSSQVSVRCEVWEVCGTRRLLRVCSFVVGCSVDSNPRLAYVSSSEHQVEVWGVWDVQGTGELRALRN